MWDLALVSFDSIKAIVFRKILPFGNIFCFPGENRSQKWTKTVNSGYIPFSPKDNFKRLFKKPVFWPNFDQFSTVE